MKVRNEKSLSFILAIFMCLTFLLTVSCTTHENTQQNTDPTAAPVPTAAPTDEIISDHTREQYIFLQKVIRDETLTGFRLLFKPCLKGFFDVSFDPYRVECVEKRCPEVICGDG